FDVTQPGCTYQWSTGSYASSINVSNAGTYWVILSNQCGAVTDSVVVSQLAPPSVNLGSDLFYCNTINATLDASTTNGNYLWSTGDTTSSISISSAGNYFVTVDN